MGGPRLVEVVAEETEPVEDREPNSLVSSRVWRDAAVSGTLTACSGAEAGGGEDGAARRQQHHPSSAASRTTTIPKKRTASCHAASS